MADLGATLVDISRDLRLAGALGRNLPTRDSVEALRGRLRSHITMLAVPAETYGRSLDGGWYGQYVLTCVASARSSGHPPAGEDAVADAL
ncbi:hypothetical protein [Streptomyces sp. NPDC048057]|uniref:hypothetical protein n=1 Tax=Streptomyces sp. NPDC048057 TaxID=3155628 RepID=UPI0034023C63